MAKVEATEKVKKERKCKMGENPKENVHVVATYKLNRYLSAVKGLGNCCGPMFDYSDSRLTPAQLAALIRETADLAATNIERGNKPGTTNNGIRL